MDKVSSKRWKFTMKSPGIGFCARGGRVFSAFRNAHSTQVRRELDVFKGFCKVESVAES